MITPLPLQSISRDMIQEPPLPANTKDSDSSESVVILSVTKKKNPPPPSHPQSLPELYTVVPNYNPCQFQSPMYVQFRIQSTVPTSNKCLKLSRWEIDRMLEREWTLLNPRERQDYDPTPPQ